MPISIPTLGVLVVDKDHQDAVTLIETAIASADNELAILLDKAAIHLADHFGREEALMDECGFFASHCHKEEHQRVLKEVVQIQILAAQGDLANVRTYLTQAFPDWLVQHANSMDTVTMMSYRTYLNSQKAVAS